MLKIFYCIFLTVFSFLIILLGINYSLSTQNSESNSSDIPLVYLSSDKKTYSVGELIRLITIVYNNNNNSNNTNPVPLKINVIKTHDEMFWWYNKRTTPEIIDSFNISPKPGSSSIYNISTIESGRYLVNANSIIKTDISNPLSFTQFGVKSIFFTLPALMLYVSIGFFIGLILVIFFGQNIIRTLFIEDETKKEEEKKEEQMVFIEIMRFVCLTGIASSFLLTLLFSDVQNRSKFSSWAGKEKYSINYKWLRFTETGEWVVNIGGGKEDNYSSGIQIPATVIIFGVAGGYLRYLYGLRYLYTSKKDGQQNFDSVDRSWGDIDINDNLSLFKHSLRSLALFFLTPLLAVSCLVCSIPGRNNR